MAGLITVGGLASGLDTNTIIDKLVKLEHRPVDQLKQQLADAQATRDAVDGVRARVLALRTAADALRSPTSVLLRRAASDDTSVLGATAGTGAERGSVVVTVAQLARGSVAGGTVGLASADATVAASEGTFKFQVGGGTVQSVDVDATTTLQQLADRLNNLDAGVTATAINLGTAASPDFRLQLASKATGASSTITVVHDDTALAVQTTQAGQNATFTVAGFSGTFQRESNTVGDVLTGVTLQLRSLGTAAVTIDDDADAITAKAKALANTFNGLVSFVSGQSTVDEAQDKSSVAVGALVGDLTVRRVLDRLHATLSEPLGGAAGRYVNLSSLGFATQKDGTISFDEAKFRAALADDPKGLAAVFAGNGVGAGIANDVQTVASQVTDLGGSLPKHDDALGEQIKTLQQRIDEGQVQVDAFEQNLRQQFASLETLVSSLRQQGDFLTSVFKK